MKIDQNFYATKFEIHSEISLNYVSFEIVKIAEKRTKRSVLMFLNELRIMIDRLYSKLSLFTSVLHF